MNFLVVGFPSENLFTLNDSEGPLGNEPPGDEPPGDISLISSGLDHGDKGVEDLFSSPNPIIPDSADLFSNADIDQSDTNIFAENGLLLTDLASPNSCATQADDLTLVARDDTDACRSKKEFVPPSNALQLFQDPMSVLNNLIPTKKKQPSGSSPPPDPNSPFYPGHLSDEEAAKKAQNPEAMKWDLGAMGLEEAPPPLGWDFNCDQPGLRNAVCCDGPVLADGGLFIGRIENCDLGTCIKKL